MGDSFISFFHGCMYDIAGYSLGIFWSEGVFCVGHRITHVCFLVYEMWGCSSLSLCVCLGYRVFVIK